MLKKTIIVLVVLAALAGLFKLAVWVVFTDHVDSKKYSISYFMRMHSEVIENAPIIMPVDTPIYGSDIPNGNAPQMYTVSYTSKQSKRKLLAELTGYLTKRKYQGPTDYWNEMYGCEYAFYNETSVVEIYIYDDEKGAVLVSMCEYP